MKKLFVLFGFALLFQCAAQAQSGAPAPATQPQTSASPAATSRSAQPSLSLADYGVQLESEPRLIVVMAALEAAGFDPVSQGKQPNAFRATVRGNNAASLSEDLRTRLRKFYDEHKLPGAATPAEQAARYVSLAFALGPVPAFELPARTDDLPAGVLEVLDFTSLVREFYRASGGEKTLAAYVSAHNLELPRLRNAATEMIRETNAYLHTRPVLIITERVPVTNNSNANNQNNNARRNAQQSRYTVRERARRFHLIPDLLAAPTAINFRVVADDYYVVVPAEANLTSSELRRAYLQFLFDPLIGRFNREIALRRADIRALLDALPKNPNDTNAATPDVFAAVARSLIVASDVRMNESARLRIVAADADAQLQRAGNDAARRAQIVRDVQETRARITDESARQLAEAYERGAALAFYFAEQLRGVETSGFDVASSLADMIASFELTREKNRLSEAATARARATAELARRRSSTTEANGMNANLESEGGRRAQLIKNLDEVDALLRARNYVEAERRLQTLMNEFQGEPRVFFALAQAASLSAQEAIDAGVQTERLGRALANYRFAINAASPETDKALLSRAHAAAGRILAFLERREEAVKEFDAAIALGDITGGAYADAVAGKKELTNQR